MSDNIYTSSDQKKVLLGFYTLRAFHFWEMALVFHYYLGKFGLKIFLDLKTKQIKYKKNTSSDRKKMVHNKK